MAKSLRLRWMAPVAWLLLVLFVPGCGQVQTAKTSPPSNSGSAQGAAVSGPATIRWGYRLTPLNIVLVNSGYDQKYNLKLETKLFPDGPDSRDALLAGTIDAAELGVTPALTALAQAPKDLVAIGVSETGGGKYRVVVPKDSPIQNMEQLKGKKIAIKVGSGNYTAFMLWAKQQGLTEKDFQIVNAGDTEAMAAMESKSVDAVAYWEPIPSILVAKGLAREIFNFNGFVQNPVLIVVRRDWIAKNPEAVKRFMAAWEDAQQFVTFYTDQAAKTSADALKKHGVSIDADVYRLSLSHSMYESWFYPALLDEVRSTWDFLKSAGKAKGDIDWSKAFDSSYQAAGLQIMVQEAINRK